MNDVKSERYAESPIKRFVDVYVLDVVGALPPEQAAAVERLDLQRIFKTRASEWRHVLRETLNLSDTFDLAILDLWLRWNEASQAEGKEYSAEQFAVGFTDDYLEDGSKIDVWPPGSLDAAKERIAASRLKH
jgi:hypothetical protein